MDGSLQKTDFRKTENGKWKTENDAHRYGTRSFGRGLPSYSALDERTIGQPLPREWQSTPQDIRETISYQGMKKKSKMTFLLQYGLFKCDVRDCFVCRNVENATGW